MAASSPWRLLLLLLLLLVHFIKLLSLCALLYDITIAHLAYWHIVRATSQIFQDEANPFDTHSCQLLPDLAYV